MFKSLVRLTLGLTQPPVQWVPGDLLGEGVSGRNVKQTTSLHLLPSSRVLELNLQSTIRLHGTTLN
jgi:hypothetical protein